MQSPGEIDDFNDPDLRFVSVTDGQLARAQAQIGSCEACDPEAEIPFDWLLRDEVSERGYVDYIIPEPARCPRCKSQIHEKTLVEPIDGIGVDVKPGVWIT
jgi:hypothetical protein